MSLAAWRAFVAICEHESVTVAAELLGYTQPAVSRQLARLERDVGVVLIDRGPRGLRPNAAGRALLPHARLLVQECERGSWAARHATTRPHLALGAVPSAAVSLLPAAMRRFSNTFSWAMLTDLSVRLARYVAERALDLAVITDAPPGLPDVAGLRVDRLASDPMVVALPVDHPLAARRRLTLAALAEQVWIEDNASSQALLLDLAARTGVTVQIELAGSDLMTKLALVAAGHGVALVPSIIGPGLRNDVRLVHVSAAPRRTLYALRHEGRSDLDELIDAIRATPPPSRTVAAQHK